MRLKRIPVFRAGIQLANGLYSHCGILRRPTGYTLDQNTIEYLRQLQENTSASLRLAIELIEPIVPESDA